MVTMISRPLFCFVGLIALLLLSSPLHAAFFDIDPLFEGINGALIQVIFFDVSFGFGLPFIVAWLVVGAVFLTIRMGFVNFRLVGHSVKVLLGRYRSPNDPGEVTPFQALTTALSATVGLGNIAGVAIAVSIGGPGATFWMIVAGLLGMSTKFTEATLAQTYREIRPDGHIMGGPMEYLARGFAERGLPRLGYALAVMFCVFAIIGALGGGNAFQVSQALTAVQQVSPWFNENAWVFGVVMAVLVTLVIIGGLRRIAQVAQTLVPVMVVVYLLAASWIILANIDAVPSAFAVIVTSAFSVEAGIGGVIGAIVQGFKRAAFSSEAGLGSAAIAHATAQSRYPARQGVVALLEPFIDTVVICTMTALVIVITGVYNAPEHAALVQGSQGAALTSVAFGSVISWFPLILSVSVILFAFSTMISWSYYGERCWTYIFGERGSMIFKVVFVFFVVIGAVTSASNILLFSELTILAMAFPNLIGLYVFSGKVKGMLDEYIGRLKSGALDMEVGRVGPASKV